MASTTTAATTATAATALAGAVTKAAVPDVSKPEPFAGSRAKFRIYCTQIRLGIWAYNKRPVDKRAMRYQEDKVL